VNPSNRDHQRPRLEAGFSTSTLYPGRSSNHRVRVGRLQEDRPPGLGSTFASNVGLPPVGEEDILKDSGCLGYSASAHPTLSASKGICTRPTLDSPLPVFEIKRRRVCRADPWTLCELARVEWGLWFARSAALPAEALANHLLSLSEAMRRDAWLSRRIMIRYFGGHDYQMNWFTDSYRVKTLKRIRRVAEDARLSRQHFLKMRNQTGRCSRYCDYQGVLVDAYTAAEIPHRVYICPQFWQKAFYANPCRAGQLWLHEFCHKDGIIGERTDDYGRDPAIALAASAAGSHFRKSRRNPENFAWFFVNLLMDPHLEKFAFEDTAANACKPYEGPVVQTPP